MSWDLIGATASLAGALIEWRRWKAGKSPRWAWIGFAATAVGLAAFALFAPDRFWR